MRLLLDTHALIWWFLDDPRLPERMGTLLDDPKSVVFVSAASAWELTTKYRSGRLQEAAELAEQLLDLIKRWRFTPLPVTVEHGHRAGLLPGDHKDPFDRMLAAQALIRGSGTGYGRPGTCRPGCSCDVVSRGPALREGKRRPARV